MAVRIVTKSKRYKLSIAFAWQPVIRCVSGRQTSLAIGRFRKTYDISALHVVLNLLNLLLELIQTDLVVLNDEVDLQLLDAVADGDELAATPDEAVLLNGADSRLHLLHVRLVVPRLDVHGDDALGRGLGLALLLLLVLCQPFVANARRLCILLLVVTAEQVDLVVVLLGRGVGLGRGVDGHGRGVGAVCGVLLGWVAGEGGELGLERGNVLVPAGGVRELGDIGLLGKSLVGLHVGLRGRVAVETGVSVMVVTMVFVRLSS